MLESNYQFADQFTAAAFALEINRVFWHTEATAIVKEWSANTVHIVHGEVPVTKRDLDTIAEDHRGE